MIDNKLINQLSSEYADENNKTSYDKQCAFIVAQSVFCWLFKRYKVTKIE